MMVVMVVLIAASIAGNVYAAWYIGKLRGDKKEQKELGENKLLAISSEFDQYKSKCYCKDIV